MTDTVGRHLPVLLQLTLATLVVHRYQVESETFGRLFTIAAAGVVVNLMLPLRVRLPFFAALSLAGAFVVFGPADASWLIGTGLVLIGICHLPVSVLSRAGALVIAGGALAVARAGIVPVPWSDAVWPILGSMFMFRLVLYMLALKSGKVDGSWLGAVAYFFMLPNLVFPLFPVVDYQTFRRTYYDREPGVIYEQGMLWVARGIVHLLLYRFVYQRVLNDPIDVATLGDLLQFMLGTFLLYLRVSGQFHLIVGMLHLFGFRLPETHKLYYLAHSFTELWRRINIYWTDFMMKAVFYPTYFKVKHLGPRRTLAVATTAVFVTTWILHSYQWFWLRGGFPLTPQDTIFWGVLGALVIGGALRESAAGKKAVTQSRWSLRLGLHAAATFSFFCFLWSLWSTESVGQWLWMLGASASVDVKGIVIAVVSLALVVGLGGRDWEARREGGRRWLQALTATPVRVMTPLIVLLVVSAPAVRAAVPTVVAASLDALHATGLNARDSAVQHRGYYEQLEVRGTPNSQVLDIVGTRAQWQDLGSLGIIHERSDLMLRELLPLKRVEWNGHQFSTNRWGMRDRDYERDKPAGTFRVALLGPSHVMGNNVGDGETFESLVETRLNKELQLPGYDRIEVLNFGVDGYSILQQVAILEDRVLAFSPDVVIATHYQSNRTMTEGALLKLVWADVAIPHEPLRALMSGAGLVDVDRGSFPVPFGWARSVARGLGVNPRMPEGEAAGRTRRIADATVEVSFERFAQVARQSGVTPAVLALNVVIDDVAPEVPNATVLRRLGLPVFDLFDVFPAARRPSLRVAPWDDHPNATGHALIAARFYDALAGLLVDARPERRAGQTTASTDGGR